MSICSSGKQWAMHLLIVCRLSFAIAADAPIMQSNISANFEALSEQLAEMNDEHKAIKQLSLKLLCQDSAEALSTISEEPCSVEVVRFFLWMFSHCDIYWIF